MPHHIHPPIAQAPKPTTEAAIPDFPNDLDFIVFLINHPVESCNRDNTNIAGLPDDGSAIALAKAEASGVSNDRRSRIAPIAPGTLTTPNANRQTPSAKRRAPTAERQTPSANRQTPSANRQTPSAKRRTPTANRQPPSTHSFRVSLNQLHGRVDLHLTKRDRSSVWKGGRGQVGQCTARG
jgi:hypothetical protein